MLTMTSFCSYVSCLDSLKERARLTLDLSGKCPGACRHCSNICQSPETELFPRVLTHVTFTVMSPLLLLSILISAVSTTICSTGCQSMFPFHWHIDCFLHVSTWFVWYPQAGWAHQVNWYVDSWVPEEELGSRYLDCKEMELGIPDALCSSA